MFSQISSNDSRIDSLKKAAVIGTSAAMVIGAGVTLYRRHYRNRRLTFSEVMDVPSVKNTHLKSIQKQFSPTKLGSRCRSRAETYFPFLESNNIYHFGSTYIEKFQTLCADKKEDIQEKRTSFFGSSYRKLGLIIGNGNILSLLPEIPADDILLIDIEPVVFYYVLSIRNFIL